MSLRVDVELTERDVLDGHAFALWQLPGTRAYVLVTTLFALGLGLLAIRAISAGGTGSTFLAGLAALAGLNVWIARRIRNRAHDVFSSMTDDARRGHYAFDDEGVAWTLGAAPGKLGWDNVTAVRETSEHVLLITRATGTHVLPKRQMQDETLRALRQLVARAGKRGQVQFF